MAKVTLTIEGDPQEIRRMLRKMLMDRPKHGGPCGQDREHDPSHEHGHGHGRGRRGHWAERKAEAMAAGGWTPWTEPELTQLWTEITAGARALLAEIAKRPEGYPNAELQQVLSMPGNAIGGTLSSVGVVSRRFGPKPPVYKYRWDMYRMPPHVAEMVNRLAQQNPPQA